MFSQLMISTQHQQTFCVSLAYWVIASYFEIAEKHFDPLNLSFAACYRFTADEIVEKFSLRSERSRRSEPTIANKIADGRVILFAFLAHCES